MTKINRRKSKRIRCGSLEIGGNAPISIQSMTTKDTRDVKAVTAQIAALSDAGADIVRVAVPDLAAAAALQEIKKELAKCAAKADIPIVADIHFDYRLAIASIKNGADKIRINPGNIGSKENLCAVAEEASARNIPIRVGVNSGSLEKEIINKYGGVTAEGIVESALDKIKLLEQTNFHDIVVSIKSSDILMNYQAHKLLANSMEYPLHIGITEAGTAAKGKLKSAMGLSPLLMEGIGDTMRISLTGDPLQEVIFAREMLETLDICKSGIRFISCPTCGRTKVNLEVIATQIESALKPTAAERKRAGLPDLTIAVMGCAVNGPGEAREADLGVACGEGKGVIFAKGEILMTVPESEISRTIIELTEKIDERY